MRPSFARSCDDSILVASSPLYVPTVDHHCTALTNGTSGSNEGKGIAAKLNYHGRTQYTWYQANGQSIRASMVRPRQGPQTDPAATMSLPAAQHYSKRSWSEEQCSTTHGTGPHMVCLRGIEVITGYRKPSRGRE